MADFDSPREDRVLLVEGADDKHVVLHLCERSRPMPPFHIKEKDGIDNLLASIGPEVKAPGRMAVGILPDANNVPEARWDALRHRLADRHLDLPERPDPDGTVVDGSPRIGIWLWPDNQEPGELENFVQTMVPPTRWGLAAGEGVRR